MVGALLAGRYRLDEEIGRGGMATVYRAFDRSLERPVAVKVLRDDLSADPTTVARFRAEAQAAARLSHPNIVQIFDTGEEGGRYFIVMEYLPEPDLKSIIRNYAPLPVHKVAEVAMQACEALGYAHQHGLVHRDVKPHNILFTADGRAKLADFGIAAAVGDRAGEASLLGSAHYISPEEVHGNAATPQSDLYSLGVVMYECLTGRTPFQGETAEAVLAKRLASPPPAPRSLNPNIPPAAEHVVVRAMARDPIQRYDSAGDMLADLRRLAAGAPVVGAGMSPTAEATQTMVLRTPPQSVTPPIMREAPPGPRQPPARARRQEGPSAAWSAFGVVIGLIALIGVVVLLKYLFYPANQGPALVQVPNVTGLPPEQAWAKLEEVGLLRGRVIEQPPTANQAAGTVIKQHPDVSERVPKNTRVDLVVTAAAPGTAAVVPIPDVVGQALDKATANLQMLDLQVGAVQELADPAPAGQVIKQSIKPGTKVAKGQAVDLTVSKGPEAAPETKEPKVPEETKNGTPGAAAAPPQADIHEDLTYAQTHPGKRKFDITVTMMGKKPGQLIEILMSDSREINTVEYSERHDPGYVIDRPVYPVGEPTIEIRWEGTLLERYPS